MVLMGLVLGAVLFLPDAASGWVRAVLVVVLVVVGNRAERENDRRELADQFEAKHGMSVDSAESLLVRWKSSGRLPKGYDGIDLMRVREDINRYRSRMR